MTTKPLTEPAITGPEHFVHISCQVSDKEAIESVHQLAGGIIETLLTAIRQTDQLAAERVRLKQSNHRACNVSRELKELVKVLSMYSV